jgi:hypothetical protein
LPDFVKNCPVTMACLKLLAPLDWDNFPNREPNHPWPGSSAHPRSAYVAAFIIKIERNLRYMSDLRAYLVDHPALVWLLGFKLVSTDQTPHGFDAAASLPTSRHLGRVLRTMPNAPLQFLLESTVSLIRQALPPEVEFGQHISLDVKHVVAWVKENNPKAYVKESDRLNKDRQPRGDPTCKLGCKRKRNQAPPSSQTETTAAASEGEKGPAGDQPASSADQLPSTPAKNPARPTTIYSADEYYWGYASGLVGTKVPGVAEVALAELTQTFDRGEATYFFPLMTDTERRLGFRPPFGALDTAFDAFYVYQYFAQAGGFAAVPFAKRGGHQGRTFDELGQPICPATGLGMPLKSTFICRTTEVEHERGRYACPLLFPEATGQTCPINHPNWAKGGCLTTMATSLGARIRYQLDRQSDDYKHLYKQRTATERLNSQAVALGIERPKLRRGSAISNQNTLIYVLINLRAFHRIRDGPQATLADPLGA